VSRVINFCSSILTTSLAFERRRRENEHGAVTLMYIYATIMMFINCRLIKGIYRPTIFFCIGRVNKKEISIKRPLYAMPRCWNRTHSNSLVRSFPPWPSYEETRIVKKLNTQLKKGEYLPHRRLFQIHWFIITILQRKTWVYLRLKGV